MSDRSLNRREFLRLGLVLASSALAASCQGKLSPSPTLAPLRSSGIKLHGGAADAWAFHRPMKGSLQDPAACQAVWIAGNGARLEATLQEDFFAAEVPIRPGANAFTAICQQLNEEEELSNRVDITGRLQQRPTARITPSISNGRVILSGGDSQPDELDEAPIHRYVWSARPDNPAPVQVSADGAQSQQLDGEIEGSSLGMEPPAVDGEYYVSLRVIDGAGRQDTAATYFVVEAGRPRIPDYDHENPAWVEEAIVYGAIPRLFGSPGAPAIQDKLEYLADLGITAIWLAPVNATIDYGYSVLDYFELRDSFGSKEDFRAMIQAAHARGIRILMDFVPNHTSNEHPYFKDTLAKGPDSPYWDFYDRDANGNYTYYFDWTHLPNLNYDNPQVRRMMLEAFSYWVREFDVDGFRVDACWGVQQRRPEFWPEWRRELKRIKPDLLLLAEASARDPYNFEQGFDAAYDWTENLGQWAWGRFWADDAPETTTAKTIELLKAALTNEPEGYHPDALIFRFLNNNDTRTRFIAKHGEELTRVATALLLTLPGLPCIYTADELGQWFLPYDSGLISWRERYRGLRDYHRKLIALRKEIPGLHARRWQLLDVEPASQVLGYLRFLAGQQEPVLVLLNFSKEPAVLKLTLPEEFMALTGDLTDRLNDEDVRFASLQMEPMSARILTSKKD